MRILPFDYAVRNLGRSRSRLLLSISGSALVVLLILVADGFVRGMSRTMRATGGEHNIVILGTGSEDSIERSEIIASSAEVISASISGIRTRAGVAFVSPEVHVMLPIRLPRDAADPGAKRQVMLRGVTPTASMVHDVVSLTSGRWPRAGEDEVVVGRMAATVIGAANDEMQVGKQIIIDKRPWTIVGKFAAPGTVIEAEIWLPMTDVKAVTRRETDSCVVITLDPFNPDTNEGAEFADVAAFAKSRPDLELAALPEREYYGKLAAFFGPIRLVAWVTAGLIAVGGLFGGLNTMYAAFASRIRELGTLQSIGFRRTAIIVSMVQESVLATATGALIACIIGVLLLDGLAVRFSMGAFGLVIDSRVVSVGLVSGIVLGIIGALPPAIRCLRPPIPVALKAV